LLLHRLGLESASKEILAHARKGVDPDRARSRSSGARVASRTGLLHHRPPGETEQTIQDTIAFSKALPLDIGCFTLPPRTRERRSSTRS